MRTPTTTPRAPCALRRLTPRRVDRGATHRPAVAWDTLEARTLFSGGGHAAGPVAPDNWAGDEIRPAAPGAAVLAAAAAPVTAAVLAAAAAPVPVAGAVPALGSNPAARVQLYLDFDGDTTATWGSYSPGATPAYDQDGDPATFSDAELANVREIWARLAEKFSPFNVNVTTVNPGVLADGQAFRLVVGGAGAWRNGVFGGATYVGSFADPATPNTGYVFEDNLGNGNPLYTAEAAAHEAGHAFGLQHHSSFAPDGTLLDEHSTGDALAAPVMGASYYSQRGLWSNAASTSATTFQDDLAILTGAGNGFGYRADDRGGTSATSTALTVTGTTLGGSGVIERTNDADWFRFTTGTGTISLNVAVAQYGATLDARLELRDAGGSLVASADTASLGETITTNVVAGTYYLVVLSHGGYGDLGQYTVGGTIVSPGATATSAEAGGPYTVAEGGGVALSGAGSAGPGLTFAWDLDGDGVFGETGAAAARGDETGVMPTFSATGLDGPAARTVSLRVTDVNGVSATDTTTVTVSNVAPTLNLSGASGANEGAAYTLSLWSNDPGPDTISKWVINWGDGTAAQTVNGNPSSVAHTYKDNGTYNVTATATDEDGTYAANVWTVAIANVAPTIALAGAATTNEGAAYTLTLGAVTDPGTDAVTQYRVDWGDGTSEVFTTAGAKGHVYADGAATRSIAVALVDEDGTFAAAGTKSVTVANVAPAVAATGGTAVLRGSPYTLKLSSSDPGADTIGKWVINWGDGTAAQTVTGNPSAVTHTYAALGTYAISATATDEDGAYAAAGPTVTAVATAPTVALSGAAAASEGAAYALTIGAVSNATGAVRQFLVDWGDGTRDTYTTGGTKTHVFADGDATRTVVVAVTDNVGTFDGAGSVAVAVANVAPALTIGGPASANTGVGYTLNLSASDPGADAISFWTIDWGDGAVEMVGGSHSTAGHTFARSGNYTVLATATDEDGTYWAAAGVAVAVVPLPADVPTATFAGGPVTAYGGAEYTFTVTYADDRALDAATFGDDDVLVTGPNGFARPARLVSVGGTGGAQYVVTYSLAAPGGTWDYSDNGTYVLSVQSPAAVTDDAGNGVPAGAPFGSFAVGIPEPTLKGRGVPGKPPKKTPLAGTAGTAALQLTNQGSATTAGTLGTTLYVSADAIFDPGDRPVGNLSKKLTLKPKKSANLKLKYTYPKDLPTGSYYLLAAVDSSHAAGGSASPTVVSWAAPTQVAQPTVDLHGRERHLVGGPPLSLTAGQKWLAPFELHNGGTVNARGSVAVSLVASVGAAYDATDPAAVTVSRQVLKLNLAPGSAKTYKLKVSVPADGLGLAPGTYQIWAVVDGDNALAESNEMNNVVLIGSAAL